MAIQAQLYSENFGFAFGGHQDSLMENGCGIDSLCFVPQQQQQQSAPFGQFQNFNHQKNHGFLGDHNVSFIPKNSINDEGSMGLSQSISAHIEKQRMEFEQFMNLQNERLRIAMQEQRKHQTALLMKKYESKTQFLLKQKEEEIAKASTRAMELQDFLKKMEIENQTWQRAARENEAMVASLHETIQRLRESITLSANAADDAQSCCHNREDENRPENYYEEGGIMKKMVCKCCNTRNSCVIMLPCRHLCSCRDCEVFLDSCPVCRMVKKASIEALI